VECGAYSTGAQRTCPPYFLPAFGWFIRRFSGGLTGLSASSVADLTPNSYTDALIASFYPLF
jgi:hypothetical protein